MLNGDTQIVRVPVVQDTRVILPPLNMKVDFDRKEPFDYTEARKQDPYFCPLGANCKTDEQREKELGQIRAKSSLRDVQMLVPSGTVFLWGLDQYPEALGPDRVYRLTPLPSGVTLRLNLLPGQWLIAAVEEGHGVLGMIIEYHAPQSR